jgi:hypothetical protein
LGRGEENDGKHYGKKEKQMKLITMLSLIILVLTISTPNTEAKVYTVRGYAEIQADYDISNHARTVIRGSIFTDPVTKKRFIISKEGRFILEIK